jgi:hypothetical protein
MFTSLMKNLYERWVFDLMVARIQDKKTFPDRDDWLYTSTDYISFFGKHVRDAGLQKISLTPGRSFPQEAWAHYVKGIMSMYEIDDFRSACSKAKQVWVETSKITRPISLWTQLPRKQREEEEEKLYAPSNIKESWLKEKLRDAAAAEAAAAEAAEAAEAAAAAKAAADAKRVAEFMEKWRYTHYHTTLLPEMIRLNTIFHNEIEYAMAPTTNPKEKIRLFLKHDGVIREYNELVYHMRSFPYHLKNYVPTYERKIGDELDKITLKRLATLEKPKRRKRLSVAAKVRYAKEWRKLNEGYHRDSINWGSYCKEHRPAFFKRVSINNVTPAKMRLLRKVYSKGV